MVVVKISGFELVQETSRPAPFTVIQPWLELPNPNANEIRYKPVSPMVIELPSELILPVSVSALPNGKLLPTATVVIGQIIVGIPLALKEPFTSNATEGVVVPMPTLPPPGFIAKSVQVSTAALCAPKYALLLYCPRTTALLAPPNAPLPAQFAPVSVP